MILRVVIKRALAFPIIAVLLKNKLKENMGRTQVFIMLFFEKSLKLNKVLLVKEKKLHLPSVFSTVIPNNCDSGCCYCTNLGFVNAFFPQDKFFPGNISVCCLKNKIPVTCSDIPQ